MGQVAMMQAFGPNRFMFVNPNGLAQKDTYDAGCPKKTKTVSHTFTTWYVVTNKKAA